MHPVIHKCKGCVNSEAIDLAVNYKFGFLHENSEV